MRHGEILIPSVRAERNVVNVHAQPACCSLPTCSAEVFAERVLQGAATGQGTAGALRGGGPAGSCSARPRALRKAGGRDAISSYCPTESLFSI